MGGSSGSAWTVWVAVIVVVVCAIVVSVEGTSALQDNFLLRAADKVRRLPEQPPVSFNQWAGYVNLDGDTTTGKHLFYYFSESPKSPSIKPLVLWLNGGTLGWDRD